MADIFISYSREDRETAKRLAAALETYGWSAWWDTRLKSGEVWDEVIERELQAARSVVVLWSASSVNSRWVRKEARYGETQGALFPALIDDVDIPLTFRDIHAEDLNGWSGDPSHLGFRDLVDALVISLGEPSPRQPRPTVQAEKSPVIAEVQKRSKTQKSEPSVKTKPSTLVHKRRLAFEPEMVMIEPGSFVMGSDKKDSEKPPHTVTIGYPFEMGKYPVTFAEYDAFCEAMGREKAGDEGWGRGRRPVINVSWDEAQAYIDWLTKGGR